MKYMEYYEVYGKLFKFAIKPEQLRISICLKIMMHKFYKCTETETSK